MNGYGPRIAGNPIPLPGPTRLPQGGSGYGVHGQVIQICQGDPADVLQLLRRAHLAVQAAVVGNEESGVEAAWRTGRRDGAEDVGEAVEGRAQAVAMEGLPRPRAPDRRRIGGPRHHQARFFHGLADRGDGQGPGAAGRRRTLQQARHFGVQIGRRLDEPVSGIDPAAREHVEPGHEHVAGVAPSHEDFDAALGAPIDDQGSGIDGADGAVHLRIHGTRPPGPPV